MTRKVSPPSVSTHVPFGAAVDEQELVAAQHDLEIGAARRTVSLDADVVVGIASTVSFGRDGLRRVLLAVIG